MRSRLASLAAAALVAGTALAACSDPPGDTAPASLADCVDNPNTCNGGERADGGTITWLVNQGWDGQWNSHRTEGNSVYQLQALAGLYPVLGQFLPDGVWEWNMDVLDAEPQTTADSPQTHVYQLRESAVWHDDTPVSADDMIWEWYHNSGNADHCVGCNPASSAGYNLIESIEGSDGGKTITVTYRDGVTDPEWFALFDDLNYPAHVADQNGFDWRNDPAAMGESSEYFRDNVPDWSGGPFLIESAVADQTVVKVPNPNWYGEVQPTLDTLIVEVLSDPGSWLPALQGREIHGGSPASFPIDILDQLASMDGIQYATGSGGAVWDHLDINLENEWLSDPALRRAIFTAIDKEDARGRIYGSLEPQFRYNHVFSQSSPYFVDHEEGTGYGTGNLDQARRILADAGYTGYEPGQTLTRDGQSVGDLRVRWLQGNENRASFVELTQSYLADIGITVSPEPVPSDQLGTVLGGQDYDMIIFGWSGSPLFATAGHVYWHSSSNNNFGGLDNPEVDRLVEAVQTEMDIDEGARLVNEAVALVYAEAYVLPLWDTTNLMFVADDYVNVRDNHVASLRALYNPEAWGVRATVE